MSDESNVAPEEAAASTDYATKEEVSALADRVTKIETANAAAAGVTPQNDQLTPDQPGVEPEPPADPPVVPAPAPEAPVSAPAPEATIEGQAPQPENPTPAPGDAPIEEAAPMPAAEASEKPLYVVVSDDPAYAVPAGYMATGLVTPDGKTLYHFTDDVAGEPGTGAVDGSLGIYADDVVPGVTQ